MLGKEKPQEQEQGCKLRIATDLGEVFVKAPESAPSRGYVVLACDAQKGNSKTGSYVSVRNGRYIGPLESLTMDDVVSLVSGSVQ